MMATVTLREAINEVLDIANEWYGILSDPAEGSHDHEIKRVLDEREMKEVLDDIARRLARISYELDRQAYVAEGRAGPPGAIWGL